MKRCMACKKCIKKNVPILTFRNPPLHSSGSKNFFSYARFFLWFSLIMFSASGLFSLSYNQLRIIQALSESNRISLFKSDYKAKMAKNAKSSDSDDLFDLISKLEDERDEARQLLIELADFAKEKSEDKF